MGGGGSHHQEPDWGAINAQRARHAEALRQQKEAQAHELARVQAEIDALKEKKAREEQEAEEAARAEREKVPRARAALKMDPDRVHVAIIGPAGAGKSSLINAVMGEDVAEVGVVETTMVSAPYAVPGTRLTLWDVPGWGTEAHPAAAYYKTQQLYAFDACVIVYSLRLPEGVRALATACVSDNVPHAIVRGKADVDVASLMRPSRDRPARSREEALAALRATVDEELAGASTFQRKFLLSARDMEDGHSTLDETTFVHFLHTAGQRGQ